MNFLSFILLLSLSAQLYAMEENNAEETVTLIEEYNALKAYSDTLTYKFQEAKEPEVLYISIRQEAEQLIMNHDFSKNLPPENQYHLQKCKVFLHHISKALQTTTFPLHPEIEEGVTLLKKAFASEGRN
jgi:hypothetical protein